MAGLTKDQILGARDLQLEEVDVPEWGGSVFVRQFSAYARDRVQTFIKKCKDSNDYTDTMAFVVAFTACDENGNRLFDTEDDVKALREKSPDALEKVFDAATKLNRMSKDGVEDLSGN